MNRYCEKIISKPSAFCEKMNMKVAPVFCKMICQGNPEPHKRISTEDGRKNMVKALPAETAKAINKELLSIIIPVSSVDTKYLARTVKSLCDNAIGELEIVAVFDGESEGVPEIPQGVEIIQNKISKGVRVTFNQGVERAKGKYIGRMDCHIAITPEWDARMKLACGEKTIAVSSFDHLDDEKWQIKGYRDLTFMYLNKRFKERWIFPGVPFRDRQTIEELMTCIGTGLIMHKDYYNWLGGCDESLHVYGALGPEWSLKTWLTGGDMVVCTDVVCGHMFRKITETYKGKIDLLPVRETRQKLSDMWTNGDGHRQTRSVEWFVAKFGPLPSWGKYSKQMEKKEELNKELVLV